MNLARCSVVALLALTGAQFVVAQDDDGQAGSPELLETIPISPDLGEEPEVRPAAVAALALDEIIVTAERKVSSLQETPISIAVFDSDKLEQLGISGVDTLAGKVPSMTIEPFPTHNATLRIFIRGVGTADAQVTQDPAVGIYLDGVYIARSVGLAIDTADLERIEVLRGPQGTLYGRNSTGGAINLITRRPSPDAFTMKHQFTGGERNQYSFKSSFNVPLADDLAIKFSAIGAKRDGFVENTGPGGDFGDSHQGAVRLDARWLPEDWLTVDYSFDHTRLKYYNSLFQAVLTPETNHGLAEVFKRFAQRNTVYSSDRLESLASSEPVRRSGSKITGHALTFDLPFEAYALKYIVAYRELIDDQYVDLGGGAGSPDFRVDTGAYDGPSADLAYGGPTPSTVPRVDQNQLSHELQFSTSLLDDTLELIVGAYAFDERGGEDGGPLHHIFNTVLDPAALDPLFVSAPELRAMLVDLASPSLVAYWDYQFEIRNKAYAVFSQGTWSPDFFARRLHLTLGLRQSWDERMAVKDFIQRQFVEGRTPIGSALAVEVPPEALGNDVFNNVRASRKDEDFSPSFNLRYDLDDDINVYAGFARAYKSGGFNVRDPQVSGASGAAADGVNYGFGFADGFKPEIVESVEVGIKSEWFGRRLRVNADVFDSDYTEMQTNFLISGSISDTKSRNVGKARMRGFEMETLFAALPGLYVSLDYSFLDAKVLEVIDVNGNNIAHLYPFVSAPRHSGTASIDWTFMQTRWGLLRASLAYNYIGTRTGTVITEERRGLTQIDGFGVLGARVSASEIRAGKSGTFELALWGRNLADHEYEIFAIDNTPQADRSVLWGEPRAIGLDLTYRYE